MTEATPIKFERLTGGTGKYILIKNRELHTLEGQQFVDAMDAVELLRELGVVDFGEEGSDREFFVMRVKDAYAADPLASYASNALKDGQQAYGDEVMKLARRAGANSPYVKKPD